MSTSIEQLIKKDCDLGEYKDLYPLVSLESVKDKNGKTLEQYLNEINHIYLPWKDNTRKATRLQVPASLRRKGLWVTYVTCNKNVVTEWYNNDSTNDTEWGNGDNWVSYLDSEVVKGLIKEILSWYKA